MKDTFPVTDHLAGERVCLISGDPIFAIQSRMDDLGLQQADLVAEFGNKTTASLIMNRKRFLTLPVIRRLAPRLTLPMPRATASGCPPDALIEAAFAGSSGGH